MTRYLPHLPSVPTRTEPPASEAGVPIGRRWGRGSQSALDYLRQDRVPRDDAQRAQAHGAESRAIGKDSERAR
jgi:hypothetical protein